MKFLNKSVTVRRILKNIPKSDTSIYSVLLRQPAKQVFAVAFGSSFFYGSFCEDLFLLLPFGSSFFMDLFMEVFFCCCLLAAVFFYKKTGKDGRSNAFDRIGRYLCNKIQ